jgi:DNA-binding NarL/FixJ family response regulator
VGALNGGAFKQTGVEVATRVLVVDDDPAIRILLRTFLESENAFEVVGEAANCSEALEITGTLHPDLVTMDYNLPDGDGTTCIREIKERWPDIHILALTSSDMATAQTMLDAGAYAKISKANMEAVMPALYRIADRRSGDRREAPGPRTAEGDGVMHGYPQLRDIVAALEAEAARSLAEEKKNLAERLELIVAMKAVLVVARNPRYSSDQALETIRSLATEILESEKHHAA